LAAEEGVSLSTEFQRSFFKAGFSGHGMVLIKAQGSGILAISAYGSLFKYVVRAGEHRVVDNHHVVAWSEGMEYEMVCERDDSIPSSCSFFSCTFLFVRNIGSPVYAGDGLAEGLLREHDERRRLDVQVGAHAHVRALAG
jgi:uncharacterized protein (AIM24 family)